MNIKRLSMVGLAVAGACYVTYAYAAGIFPNYPVVGAASYCAGSSSSATPTGGSAVTGCPNTVPAGPSIVTGNEQIPADTRLTNGVAPQTVLIGMASLNALPITVSSLSAATAGNSITPGNLAGGVMIVSAASLSPTTVFLPTSPIDGQQFRVSSNATIAVLVITPGNNASVVSQSPTALTVSTTATYGYDFLFSAAKATWYRIQ